MFAIVQCTQVKSKSNDSRGPAYAGSSACISCHKDLTESAVHNSHFNASKMLTKPNSADSLHIPDGEFVFNKQTKLQVKNRAGSLYQSALINGVNQTLYHRFPLLHLIQSRT
ncbi:hypothetical protein [Pedobacter sp. NJ-S-72]